MIVLTAPTAAAVGATILIAMLAMIIVVIDIGMFMASLPGARRGARAAPDLPPGSRIPACLARAAALGLGTRAHEDQGRPRERLRLPHGTLRTPTPRNEGHKRRMIIVVIDIGMFMASLPGARRGARAAPDPPPGSRIPACLARAAALGLGTRAHEDQGRPRERLRLPHGTLRTPTPRNEGHKRRGQLSRGAILPLALSMAREGV